MRPLVLLLLLAASAGAAPPSGKTSDPITLLGDVATFDVANGIYEVRGQAVARRGDGVLSAARIFYQHKRRFLQSSGNVRFHEPRCTVTAGMLEYDLETEWLSTRQSPKAHMRSYGKVGETTLTAETITFDRARERLLAERNVSTRVHSSAGKKYDVKSEQLESFMKDQRSVFKGNVKIAARDMGAEGDRAVFYEKTEKLHVIGNAKAWTIGTAAEPGRIVEGHQLIHDTKSGRTVALQGVRMKEAGKRKTVKLR